ncbi:MAG: hypothetical protein Q9213_003236 [Squamulea squamosa]
MSATLHERPSEAPSKCMNPDIQPILHLKADDVPKDQIFLPPSYLPCLDATPGADCSWQVTEVPFKDVVGLRSFGSRHEVSSASVLQAAWALVLRCYIGNPLVCFACNFSGDTANGHATTTPDTVEDICMAEIEAGMPVMELVKQIAKHCSKVYPPLIQSQPYCALGTQLYNRVHVNTRLRFRDESSQAWPSTCDSMSCKGNNGSVDVIVTTILSQNGLLATVSYRQSVLSVVSATNVASVYAKAIQEIMNHPFRAVKDIDLLSTRDLDQIRMWNHEFPQKVDSCVHDLVLRHAESLPQSPAVCSWDGDLTYLELEKLSSTLTRKFIRAGIRRETLVPVCFEKSLYAVVAMVAILRAGGAFVPLDPSHPTDRLKAIIGKAGAKLVVTSPKTAPLFHDIHVSIIEVSPSLVESSNYPFDDCIPAAQPDHAAFVLFTSGSTGRPKGIIQEHASVCTSAIAHGNAMRVTSSSRVFQYAAFTFDVSMMDIFTTLIHGGCVCIPSEEDRMGVFTSAMNRMRVTGCYSRPRLLR